MAHAIHRKVSGVFVPHPFLLRIQYANHRRRLVTRKLFAEPCQPGSPPLLPILLHLVSAGGEGAMELVEGENLAVNARGGRRF